MIIEGIVTTLDPNGEANISPMGPVLDLASKSIELRPFRGSRTLSNLVARPTGVFHLTDDALLIAQAVTKYWVEKPVLEPAAIIPGWVIPTACTWHEFHCSLIDQSANRAVVKASIVGSGRGPEFKGFNRAKHALIEAAVVVSRIDFLPAAEIEQALQNVRLLCDKTGSEREFEALRVLQRFVNQRDTRDGPSTAAPIRSTDNVP